MYIYFACCHDTTKPSVSHSFCFTARLCSTIQVFFFLLPCLQFITFQVTQNLLPSTLHLRMVISALGRRWCLQDRNFTGNVLGLSVSSGATWAFSSCAGVPASQLTAIRPGTWCFVPRSNASAWRKRASLLAHTCLGAWRISLALSYYKLVVSKVVRTFVKPQVLIAGGGNALQHCGLQGVRGTCSVCSPGTGWKADPRASL